MQCRIAPSLGALEGHPNDVWGTTDYLDQYEPTVFFGIYGLPDFYTLWRHQGKKYILWAGSDIRHLINGYFLDDDGSTRISVRPIATWISKNCESWVENQVEYEALKKVGIESKIAPSFMGDPKDYPVCYQPGGKVKLYTSVSGNNFELYGWHKIPELAFINPDVEFHLYGNTKEPPFFLSYKENIILHGRVPTEKMNEETKHMTGALRLTEFDGFSEIIAKSILWGQLPISEISYPWTMSVKNIDNLHRMTEPPVHLRRSLLKVLNKYPWNIK